MRVKMICAEEYLEAPDTKIGREVGLKMGGFS